MQDPAINKVELEDNGVPKDLKPNLKEVEIKPTLRPDDYQSHFERIQKDKEQKEAGKEYVNQYSTKSDIKASDYPRILSDMGVVPTSFSKTELQDLNADKQGGWSALFNSQVKLGAKTGINFFGGLATLPVGIVQAISQNRFSAIYDNVASEAIDKSSEWLDKELPVYQTSDYAQYDFGGRLVNYPLVFIDNQSNSLAFIAGAVLDAIVTEGLSAPVHAAMATRLLRAATKFEKAIAAGEDVSKIASITTRLANNAETLNGARRVINGLGTATHYESSVEAYQTMKQLRDNLYENYRNTHAGEDPSQEEKDKIENYVRKAGTSTYLWNMGIVGLDNMAVMPSLFGMKLSAGKSLYNRLMYSVDKEGVASVNKVFSRLIHPIYKTGKIAFMEGPFEEGSQNTVSNAYINYYTKQYDPDIEGTAYSAIDELGRAFVDTYTSKDGLDQVISGSMMALIGMPGFKRVNKTRVDKETGKQEAFEGKRLTWNGGIYDALIGGNRTRRKEAEQNVKEYNETNKEKIKQFYRENPDFLVGQQEKYRSLIGNMSDMEKMSESLREGNIYGFQNQKKDLFYRFIQTRLKTGRKDQLIKDVESFRNLSNDDFKSAFFGANSTIEINDSVKGKIIESFLKKIDSVSKINETVEFAYGNYDEELKDALKYSLMTTDDVSKRKRDIASKIRELSQGILNEDKVLAITDLKLLESKIDEIEKKHKQYVGFYNDAVSRRKKETDEKKKAELDDTIEYLKYNIGVTKSEIIRHNELKKIKDSENVPEYKNNIDEFGRSVDAIIDRHPEHTNEINSMLKDLELLHELEKDSIDFFKRMVGIKVSKVEFLKSLMAAQLSMQERIENANNAFENTVVKEMQSKPENNGLTKEQLLTKFHIDVLNEVQYAKDLIKTAPGLLRRNGMEFVLSTDVLNAANSSNNADLKKSAIDAIKATYEKNKDEQTWGLNVDGLSKEEISAAKISMAKILRNEGIDIPKLQEEIDLEAKQKKEKQELIEKKKKDLNIDAAIGNQDHAGYIFTNKNGKEEHLFVVSEVDENGDVEVNEFNNPVFQTKKVSIFNLKPIVNLVETPLFPELGTSGINNTNDTGEDLEEEQDAVSTLNSQEGQKKKNKGAKTSEVANVSDRIGMASSVGTKIFPTTSSVVMKKQFAGSFKDGTYVFQRDPSGRADVANEDSTIDYPFINSYKNLRHGDQIELELENEDGSGQDYIKSLDDDLKEFSEHKDIYNDDSSFNDNDLKDPNSSYKLARIAIYAVDKTGRHKIGYYQLPHRVGVKEYNDKVEYYNSQIKLQKDIIESSKNADEVRTANSVIKYLEFFLQQEKDNFAKRIAARNNCLSDRKLLFEKFASSKTVTTRVAQKGTGKLLTLIDKNGNIITKIDDGGVEKNIDPFELFKNEGHNNGGLFFVYTKGNAIISAKGAVATPEMTRSINEFNSRQQKNNESKLSVIPDGMVFVMIRSNNGRFMPAPVFANKISQDVAKQLVDQLFSMSKSTYKDIQDKIGHIVYVSNKLKYLSKYKGVSHVLRFGVDNGRNYIQYTGSSTSNAGEKIFLDTLDDAAIKDKLIKHLTTMSRNLDIKALNDIIYQENSLQGALSTNVYEQDGSFFGETYIELDPISKKDVEAPPVNFREENSAFMFEASAQDVVGVDNETPYDNQDNSSSTEAELVERPISNNSADVIGVDDSQTVAQDDTDVPVKKTSSRITIRRKGADPFNGQSPFKRSTGVLYSSEKTDITKFLLWAQRVLPGVDVNNLLSDLRHIHGQQDVAAWGTIKNGIIYLLKNAPSTTGYHEAFHIVFRYLIDDAKRQELYVEAKSKYGELSEYDLEEKMADDFEIFKSMPDSIKEKKLSKWQKILNYFKSLLRIGNAIERHGNKIDAFFNAIDSGQYANTSKKAAKNSMFYDSFAPRYSIPGLSERQLYKAAGFVSNRFLNILYDKISEGMLSIRDINAKSIFSNVQNHFLLKSRTNDIITDIRKHGFTYNDIFNKYGMLISSMQYEIIKSRKHDGYYSDNQVELFQNIVKNFDAIANMSKRSLISYGIKFTENSGIATADNIETVEDDINADVSTQEESLNNISKDSKGFGDMLSIPGIKSATTRIKYMLSSIPMKEYDRTTGRFGRSVVDNEFQEPLFHDFQELFYYLRRNLTGIDDYEGMIKQMHMLSDARPEIKHIISRLEPTEDTEPTAEQLRLQNDFKATMSAQQLKFILVKYELQKGGTPKFKIIEPNRMSMQKTLATEWMYNVKDQTKCAISYVDDNGNIKLDSEKTGKAKTFWADYMSRGKQSSSTIQAFLIKLGINLSVQTIESEEFDATAKNYVKDIIGWLDDIANNKDKETYEGRYYQLANIEINTRQELHDSIMSNVENERIYTIQLPSYLSKKTNIINRPENVKAFAEWFKSIKDNPLYKRSNLFNTLFQDPNARSKFQVAYLDGLNSVTQSSKIGKKFTKTEGRDTKASRFALYVNNNDSFGWMTYITPSDKTMGPMFFLKKLSYKLNDDGTIDKNSDLFKSLFDKLLAEVERASEAYRIVQMYEAGEINDKNIIPGYHTDAKTGKTRDKNGKLLGGAFKSQRTNLSQDEFMDIVLKQYNGEVDYTVENEESYALKDKFADYIDEVIQDTIDDFENDGLISKNKNGDYVAKYIDNAHITRTYNSQDENGEDVENANINMRHHIAGFALHTYLYNIELSDLFNGDAAFYGNELGKRTYQSQSMIKSGRIDPEDGPMRMLIVNDVSLDSDEVEGIREALEKISPEIGSKADDYKKMKVTDGTVFIMPHERMTLLSSMGLWDETQQRAHDIEEYGDTSSKRSGIRGDIGAIKTFTYNISNRVIVDKDGRPQGNIYVPVQEKCAEYTLYNSLIEGNPVLQKIKRAMIASGATHFAFASSIKEGGQKIIDFKDIDNINEENANEYILEIDRDNHGVQQENPNHHLDSENNALRQFRMLIDAAVSDDMVFPDGRKGSDVKSEIDELTAQNIQDDLAEIIELFNSPDGKKKLYNYLKEESIKLNWTINLEKLFEIDESTGEFKRTLSSKSVEIERLISALFKHRVIKQKLPGGSAVQMVSLGFGYKKTLADQQKEVDANASLKDIQKTLQFVKNVDGKIVKCQVMLPAFAKEFFTDDNGSIIDPAILPEDLRTLIGFRIPTEGYHSMLPMEIVGFLPESYGSIMLVPGEVVVQMGSDFDIDKVYFLHKYMRKMLISDMSEDEIKKLIGDDYKDIYDKYISLKENKIKFKSLTREEQEHVKNIDKHLKSKFVSVKYDSTKDIKENSKEARVNQIFDDYLNILLHPDIYGWMMYPSNFDHLTSMAREIEAEKVGDKKYNFFTAAGQERVKDINHTGIYLKGKIAVHGTGHAALVKIGAELTVKDKIKNAMVSFNGDQERSISGMYSKSGKLITKEINAFLAAVLDDMKDPKMKTLGINENTVGIAMLILHAGFDANTAINFVTQPAVAEVLNILKENRYSIKDRSARPRRADSLITKGVDGNYIDKLEAVSKALLAKDKKLSKGVDSELSHMRSVISDDTPSNMVFDLSDADMVKFRKAYNNGSMDELLGADIETLNTDQLMSLARIYMHNIKVIQNFIAYEKMSRDLGKFIRMLNSNKEIGPRYEDAANFSEMYADMTDPDANFCISNVNKIPSEYKTISACLDAAHSLSSILNGFFGYGSSLFRKVKKSIASEVTKATRTLTPDQKNVIDKELEGALNIFYFLNELGVDQEYLDQIMRGKVVEYKSETSKKIGYAEDEDGNPIVPLALTLKAMKESKKYKDMALIKGLSYHIDGDKLRGKNSISLKSPKIDPLLLDTMTSEWLQLYRSEDADEQNFATDLMIYAMYNTNMWYSQGAFYSIIPQEMLDELGYSEFKNTLLEKMLDPATEDKFLREVTLDRFIDQFVRHHTEFIAAVDEDAITFTKEDKNKKNADVYDSCVIDFSKMKQGQKDQVKVSYDWDTKTYTPVKYFKYFNKQVNKMVLFRLSEEIGPNKYKFVSIEPLGAYRGRGREYNILDDKEKSMYGHNDPAKVIVTDEESLGNINPKLNEKREQRAVDRFMLSLSDVDSDGDVKVNFDENSFNEREEEFNEEREEDFSDPYDEFDEVDEEEYLADKTDAQKEEYDSFKDKMKSLFGGKKSDDVDVNFKETGGLFDIDNDDEDTAIYTNHSGGAVGSDTIWSEIGSKFGVKTNHYYVVGNKTPNGNTAITQAQANEADIHLKKANEKLNRRFPTTNNFVNNLLRRNWQQVKNSDSVFAIGSLSNDNDSIVNGGTGWAVQMAIDNKKPVYLFDQNKDIWLSYDYASGRFIGLKNTPKLTKNFAGIGTRELQENGRNAIKDVYENTFSVMPQLQSVDDEWDSIEADSVYMGTKTIKTFHSSTAEMYKRTYGRNFDVTIRQSRDVMGRDVYSVNISKKENSPQLDNSSNAKNSNKKLDHIMKSVAMSIGIKIEFVDEIIDVNGNNLIAAYSALKNVIQISRGLSNKNTLPEEIAHALLEAVNPSHPVYQELYSEVKNIGLNAALGAEYNGYYKFYNGNEKAMIKEAMGKIFTSYMVDTFDKHYPSTWTKIKNACKKIWSWLKSRFVKVNLDDLEQTVGVILPETARFAEDIVTSRDSKIPLVLRQWAVGNIDSSLIGTSTAVYAQIYGRKVAEMQEEQYVRGTISVEKNNIAILRRGEKNIIVQKADDIKYNPGDLAKVVLHYGKPTNNHVKIDGNTWVDDFTKLSTEEKDSFAKNYGGYNSFSEMMSKNYFLKKGSEQEKKYPFLLQFVSGEQPGRIVKFVKSEEKVATPKSKLDEIGKLANTVKYFYRLQKKLERELIGANKKKDTELSDRLTDKINTIVDKLSAFRDTLSHAILYELAYAEVEEVKKLLEDNEIIEDEKVLINAYNTLEQFKEFPGLETLVGGLQTNLFYHQVEYAKSMYNVYSMRYNDKGELIPYTDEDVLASEKDISSYMKHIGALADTHSILAQTIAAMGKSAVNRRGRANEAATVRIKEALDSLTKFQNSRGIHGKKIFDIFIQEKYGTLAFVSPFTDDYYRLKSNAFHNLRSDDKRLRIEAGKWIDENVNDESNHKKWYSENWKTINEKGNEPLREFYDFFVKEIQDAAERLPAGLRIGVDFIPNVAKGLYENIIESGEKAFIGNVADVMLEEMTSINKINDDGEIVMFDESIYTSDMPMKYLNKLPSNKKNRNLAESLLKFVQFSNTYSEMSEVLPKIRVLQNILNTKQDGRGVIDKNGNMIIAGKDSNLNKAINSYIEMQVKGKTKKDDGKIVWKRRINAKGQEEEVYTYATRILDFALKYNSMLRIGFNPFNAINNVFFGKIQNQIEAVSGRYFNSKQLALADFEMRTVFNKDSKLNNIINLLRPLQELADYEQIGKVKINAGWRKIADPDHAYFMQTKGEYWLQGQICVASLMHDTIVTESGERISLWDCFDKEGKWDEKKTGMTITELDIDKMSSKIQRINQIIHGRYSSADAGAAYQHSLFRAFIQFRKWIPTALEQRLEKKHFDNRLGMDVEGRYRTVMRVFHEQGFTGFARLLKETAQTVGKLKDGKEFSELEIYNMRKNITDLFVFAATMIMAYGVFSGDDEDKNPLMVFVANQANRLAGDIANMYNPRFYLNIPTTIPVVKLFSDLVEINFQIVHIFGGNKSTYRSGIRKGENKFWAKVQDVTFGVKPVRDVARIFGGNKPRNQDIMQQRQ